MYHNTSKIAGRIPGDSIGCQLGTPHFRNDIHHLPGKNPASRGKDGYAGTALASISYSRVIEVF